MRAYDVAVGMLSKNPETVLRMSNLILKMATKTYKERERLLFKAYDVFAKIENNAKSLSSVYTPTNKMIITRAIWMIKHSKEDDKCPCYILFDQFDQNGEKLSKKYGFELLESKKKGEKHICLIKCPACKQKFEVIEIFDGGINTTTTHKRIEEN